MNHTPGGVNPDQITDDSKISPKNGFLDPRTTKTDISVSRVVVLPAPFERTTSFLKGTSKAPEAILSASHQVELYDPVSKSETIAQVIHTASPLDNFSELPTTGYLDCLRKETLRYLKMNKLVVVIGGEHTISLASWQAYQQRFPKLGLLQLDAHADLRNSYEGNRYSHASVMRRILETKPYLVTAVGIRSFCQEEAEIYEKGSVTLFEGRELVNGNSWIDRVIDTLPEHVYITIDVDVFDPSVVPAVGTPEPGGLLWWQMIEFLERLTASRRVVGFDLVELCPSDILAYADFSCAKLIYLLICMILYRSGLYLPNRDVKKNKKVHPKKLEE